MSCCEHCPLPKNPEDEAFHASVRALRDHGARAIVRAIKARRPVVTTNVTVRRVTDADTLGRQSMRPVTMDPRDYRGLPFTPKDC